MATAERRQAVCSADRGRLDLPYSVVTLLQFFLKSPKSQIHIVIAAFSGYDIVHLNIEINFYSFIFMGYSFLAKVHSILSYDYDFRLRLGFYLQCKKYFAILYKLYVDAFTL